MPSNILVRAAAAILTAAALAACAGSQTGEEPQAEQAEPVYDRYAGAWEDRFAVHSQALANTGTSLNAGLAGPDVAVRNVTGLSSGQAALFGRLDTVRAFQDYRRTEVDMADTLVWLRSRSGAQIKALREAGLERDQLMDIMQPAGARPTGVAPGTDPAIAYRIGALRETQLLTEELLRLDAS